MRRNQLSAHGELGRRRRGGQKRQFESLPVRRQGPAFELRRNNKSGRAKRNSGVSARRSLRRTPRSKVVNRKIVNRVVEQRSISEPILNISVQCGTISGKTLP